jgi:hypothetical protein
MIAFFGFGATTSWRSAFNLAVKAMTGGMAFLWRISVRI